MFLIILLGVALIALTYLEILETPIWLGGSLIGFGILFPYIKDLFQGVARNATNQTDSAGNELNSCGCTGSLVRLVDKGGFPRSFSRDRTSTVPCSRALAIIDDRPGRYFINGCS